MDTLKKVNLFGVQFKPYVFGFAFYSNDEQAENFFDDEEDFKILTNNIFVPKTANEVAETITPGLTNQIVKNSDWDKVEKNEIFIQTGINTDENTMIIVQKRLVFLS